MIGVNDNQTFEQFKANEPPTPSLALGDPARVTAYILHRQDVPGGWALTRHGITKLHPQMFPERMSFPTAAAPHPLCPENRLSGLVPPGHVRCAPPSKAKKPLPSYLRVVA